MKVVAVTGGRDVVPTKEELRLFLRWCDDQGVDEVRHGDCNEITRPDGSRIRGVDRTVADASTDHGMRVVAFPAHWDTHVRAAGAIRNKEMLLGERGSAGTVHALVAWPGGRGTADCKRRAQANGIDVIEIEQLKDTEERTTMDKEAATVIDMEAFADVRAGTDAQEDEAKGLLKQIEVFEINGDEDMQFAAEMLAEVKGAKKRLENERGRATKPLREGLEVIRGWFRPAIKYLGQCEKQLKAKIKKAKDRLIEKQQEALDRAGEASLAGDKEGAREALAESKEAKVTNVKGLQFREVWRYEVEDITQVPDEFLLLIVNDEAVTAYIKEHKEKAEIPGIKVIKDTNVASRSA